MIELRTPNGVIFIRPEAVEAIEDAPRFSASADEPASLIFSTAGTAFPVVGSPAELRNRVQAALNSPRYRPDLDPIADQAAAILSAAASRSASHTKAFDLGADEALRALADHLGVTAWAWVNESGSFAGDVTLTIESILAAAAPQAPAASAADEVAPFPAGADAEPVQLTPHPAPLVTALRALADALQDEIESSLGRELRSRDLPREWHEAQRLLGDAPNTDQGAEETPKERRQRLRRALSGPTKPSV